MYLLDANTYIQAKNFHYQMSFCPAYWHWLDHHTGLGNIKSISSVYDELADGTDELSQWVKGRKGHFISVEDQGIQQQFAHVAAHVAALEGKNPLDVANFLSKADPWLISTAIVNGATIVTHEVLVPPSSSKVKIPNICNDFDVPFITTWDLLNVLQAEFSFVAA